jgi:hypothetical protein
MMKSVLLELDEITGGDEEPPLFVKFFEDLDKEPRVFWIAYPRSRVLLEQVARKCLEVKMAQIAEKVAEESAKKFGAKAA